MADSKQIHSCHCINMRRAANIISKVYDAYFKPSGISANQFSLLVSLDEMNGATYTELAEYVGLDKSTITRTIRPLVERGLVEDISAPRKRSRQLRLTEIGIQKLNDSAVFWQTAQTDIESQVGSENMATVEKILQSLQNQ